MRDTKKLRLLRAITEQIELVATPTYDFDLAGKVFRGRTVFGDETKAPFVSILEPPRQPGDLPVGDNKQIRQVEWTLLVQGWATDDKTNPLDPAYVLLASVEQVLSRFVLESQGRPVYPDDFRIRRLADEVVIGPGICRPPNELSVFAFFYLPMLVRYKEDIANPFV